MNCKLCDEDVYAGDPPTRATGCCQGCRDKLGIIPMPPARRPARPCNRCNGTRLVRVVPRELSAIGSDYVWSVAAPMAVTLHPETSKKMLFSGNNVAEPKPSRGVGTLELYVCSGCGFVEWYCVDPEKIPIGPEYMTEIVDVTPGSPFRG